ncbi:hypothetical protein M752DRAFT_4612 [Aspergillus phoenicis ATCC 13157]|uniref:Uncharacterized protein n=1 Tax=Aspergillus phoenicis ATCC 13157 TaxID=1353007 RepID=A0A370PZW2_ASPPH|nr:hypothetical protein M752DRAFT_4612 [Aspergillus phoenicis ATCC 13157]
MNTIIPLCVMYVVCVLCIVCDVCVLCVCSVCCVCRVRCVCVVFSVWFGVFCVLFGVFSLSLSLFFYPWVWMDGLWDFWEHWTGVEYAGHSGWDGQQQEIPLTTMNKIPPRNVDHVSRTIL